MSATPDSHTFPFGLKARDLPTRSGFEVEDRHLTTRAEANAFKAPHGVATAPQILIDGQRIIGSPACCAISTIAAFTSQEISVHSRKLRTSLRAVAIAWRRHVT